MAYSGTTAATSLANPPRLILRGGPSIPGTTGLSTATDDQHQQGGGLWYYASTNATIDIVASDFFSDGFYIGMKPGDLVGGVQFTSAGSTVTTFLGAITGVSTSGASLSTGSLITSTFG